MELRHLVKGLALLGLCPLCAKRHRSAGSRPDALTSEVRK